MHHHLSHDDTEVQPDNQLLNVPPVIPLEERILETVVSITTETQEASAEMLPTNGSMGMLYHLAYAIADYM